MQNVLNKTDTFLNWIDGLKDQRGRARVLSRLVAAGNGNFGDCGSVGEGVSEMRIHFGPGYRVYFAQEGRNIYLLIAGGDKSTQERDIKLAKTMWKDLKKAGDA
ncbi:type II toxin-antitoxin system RelE/ParE family toxin [Desulfovibrio sp. OttesenSCG-928-F20]|nr:type II toxin-antitoxin system RelE/ParE family toxin [Desulfovibrio sp. OttesenSCG-928-F20]